MGPGRLAGTSQMYWDIPEEEGQAMGLGLGNVRVGSAGHVWIVIGTAESTLIQTVEDVLWRMCKGWEIVQRG